MNLQALTRRIAYLIAGPTLCFAALVQAQSAQMLPANATGGYRIAGVLVNAASGEPVRRGVVQALNADGRAAASCLTDNDGRFALNHLAAAKYQLSASKRGFRTQGYDEHDEFATSIVTGPDQDTTHLQFRLMPNALLRGVVTSDDGEPVAGARVMLFKRPKHQGTGERTAQADTAVTDDTGAYEFGSVASGGYLLAVVAEPWYAVHDAAAAKRNSALDVVYPVTYFDSTTEEQSATPIELTGGTAQEANISLHAVPAIRLSIAVPRKADGTVAMPQVQKLVFGNPVGSEGSADILPAILASDTGAMEMSGIAPGHYELTQGDPPRVSDINLSSNQQIDAEAGNVANGLEGRIRMLSGAQVPDQVTLSLERVDSGPAQGQYATEARQARFKFEPVTPGEFALWATSGDKAMPVVAVSVGASQRAGNVFTVRDRVPPLLVTLSEADTRIEGFAKKDGKGFAGAMMVLLPRNTAQWKALTRRDQSDSDGSFAFRDVAPGEYTAIAIEDGWPLDWTSPAAMARYLPGGTNVTVTANSGALVRLTSPVTVEQR